MIPSVLLGSLPDPDQTVTLNREQTHYVSRVLRLRNGDRLFLFDGKGERREAVVTDINPRNAILLCTLRVSATAESPLRITLFQGLPKGEKMDLIIQKVTELGTHAVVPVITERTQVHKTGRTARWRRVAEAAAAQCGRSTVPTISDPMTVQAALKYRRSPGIVFWEEEAPPLSRLANLRPSGGELCVLVGPEGGLTETEVTQAEVSGFRRAGLGPRLLRTETAAIVTVALVQHLYGDLGNSPVER